MWHITATDGRVNRIGGMIELLLPSSNLSPQPKQQIYRFSRFCTAYGRKSLYFTLGTPSPKIAHSWVFLWAGCSSSHSTVSVKTLKWTQSTNPNQWPSLISFSSTAGLLMEEASTFISVIWQDNSSWIQISCLHRHQVRQRSVESLFTSASEVITLWQYFDCLLIRMLEIFLPTWKFVCLLIMAALRSRCGHYISSFRFFFFFLSIFFPRLFSAVADWMSTILPHMVWP